MLININFTNVYKTQIGRQVNVQKEQTRIQQQPQIVEYPRLYCTVTMMLLAQRTSEGQSADTHLPVASVLDAMLPRPVAAAAPAMASWTVYLRAAVVCAAMPRIRRSHFRQRAASTVALERVQLHDGVPTTTTRVRWSLGTPIVHVFAVRWSTGKRARVIACQPTDGDEVIVDEKYRDHPGKAGLMDTVRVPKHALRDAHTQSQCRDSRRLCKHYIDGVQ